MAATFTLAELVSRCAEALARLGQHNGQVQGVPDVRMVRWYASLGLIDRPAAWRGRTALYGRRHLLQITTVKRLQAKGLPLARVQELMLGADDERLRELAGLSAEDLADESTPPGARGSTVEEAEIGSAPAASRARSAFWSAPASTMATPPAEFAPPSVQPRLRVDLPGGASLDLPGARLDAAAWRTLADALRPLRTWLADHHQPTEHP